MNEYLAKVAFTLDDKNYWVDYDFKLEFVKEDIEKAYAHIIKVIKDRFYVEISNNAIKNRSRIYVDTKSGETKEVGWVYRVQMHMDNGTRYVKKNGYAWVEIKQLIEC